MFFLDKPINSNFFEIPFLILNPFCRINSGIKINKINFVIIFAGLVIASVNGQ